MGTKQSFKTYQRGQRIQDTTVSFASGMSYTNAPLLEGFSRLLVNYDFGESGQTLKPRRGFRTTEEGLFSQLEPTLPYQGPNTITGSDGMSIVAGNQTTVDGTTYYQIIVGRITEYDGHGVPVGDAWVLTCYVSEDFDRAISVIHWKPLNTTETGKCFFARQDGSTTIHGMPINTSEYIKRHVGTFAFNGGYYYFCTDGKLHYTKFNETTKGFEPEVVTAYKPYQSETQNSLYNMLLDEPYTFENQLIPGVLRLTGFMPCDPKTGKTKLNPQTNIAYDYKLFYTYPEAGKKYRFHIEYNTGETDAWYPIDRDESESQVAGTTPFEFKGLRVNSTFAQFRIYAIAEKEDEQLTESNQLNLDALANSIRLTASFNYAGYSKSDSTTNAELVRYDLSSSIGMTYWKNRLWVFGARDRETGRQDNTILFASNTNRPDWFPYTANADIFDEEIVCLQPMLDDLLVFTNHNLYSITLDADGLSWTRKHLQANLNLNKWDSSFIQIVKNMVFFKSGNYFYMVVPKLTAASGAGLAIAPVSKNITYLLDNFDTVVPQVVDDLYNYSCYSRFGNRSKVTYDLKLIHYYNFLDNEDVHNCYIFEATKKEKIKYLGGASYTTKDTTVYLNFELLYNTVSRTWRIYTTESQSIRQPLFMNATGRGKHAELISHGGYVGIQLLQYSDTLLQDMYIKNNILSSETPEPTAPNVFNNWQYLDTGTLDQNTDMKKRFREYQFKINNPYSKLLKFYSGFMLDRGIRTYEMLYNYTEIDDEDESTATLVIDAQPYSGMQGAPVVQDTVPTESDYEYTTLGSWKLGSSKFPKTITWKIRIPTSGKGYLPRVILISYNSSEYELISCATVYRQLYSR